MAAPLLLLALALVRTDADTTVHLPRNGAVEIDAQNRNVVLHTGTTDLVTIHGGRAELDGGTLQVDGDDGRDRNAGTVDVTVPAWARVEITTIGGNITATGALEQVHIETVNGFIHLSGAAGVAELESVAGDVAVSDFRGSKLSIDATNENVTVTNATGALDISNVNGSVALHGIHATSATAGSINGAVEFEGTLLPTGRYDFSSQNSDVTLWLPADVSAQMHISTMNGALTTELPATTTGTQNSSGNSDGEHSFTVVYGGGAARVSVDVFNGNIVVKRAAISRSRSP